MIARMSWCFTTDPQEDFETRTGLEVQWPSMPRQEVDMSSQSMIFWASPSEADRNADPICVPSVA